MLSRVCSGTIVIKGLEDVGAVIAVEAEVASEEVSKIPEATIRTIGVAETSIKEVAIISTKVVEVASTRWEIARVDSRTKTASHRAQDKDQTTKLSCADILSFMEIADTKTSAHMHMERQSSDNTKMLLATVVAVVQTK